MNVATIAFGSGIGLLIYVIINSRIEFKGITLPKLTPKARILVFIVSIILNSIGLYLSNHSYTEEVTFYNPIYRDYRLDICLIRGGIGCGSEPANKWCRNEKKFKFSSDFTVSQVGLSGIPTKLIGDETVCEEKFCTAYTSITCLK